ncbi:hypothetical protein B0H13DRAFT_863272 [Mycena leptocephala]|nr:hypothetical protein B0H13DRAFT_863272 [Mycena leptocephala]
MFSVLRQRCLRASTSTRAARHSLRSARVILDGDSAPADLSEDNDAVDGRRPAASRRAPSLQPTSATWQTHRAALKSAFLGGWGPPRKLSREAMDGLRQLHRVDPERFTTPVLAERFRISPEAVRRILKSRWAPPPGKKAKLIKREVQAKAQFLSLSALRERMEARPRGRACCAARGCWCGAGVGVGEGGRARGRRRPGTRHPSARQAHV